MCHEDSLLTLSLVVYSLGEMSVHSQGLIRSDGRKLPSVQRGLRFMRFCFEQVQISCPRGGGGGFTEGEGRPEDGPILF